MNPHCLWFPVAGSAIWWFILQIDEPNGLDLHHARRGIFPYFLVHLEHQSRTFRMEIFSASGKNWHRVYNENYMVRNSTSTRPSTRSRLTEMTYSGKWMYTVPDGTYYAKISVLKANGDVSNPAHWEIWTSPNFVIDRP